MSKPIWPSNIKIPVLGVTGDYSSGKSLFITTIDPANTLVFDWEQSLGSYESLGFTRVNVPEILNQLYPDGYSPADAFVWWKDQISQIQPGQYSVIGVDPISDIEEGLVEWVKSRHKEWGFKTEESFVSTGGIFWSKTKSEWKKILVDLSVRCQTFAYTTHLKVVWKNGKPTKETTAKGKSTLRELASLFLFMERPYGQEVPSARVIKTRLAVAKTVDDDISIVPVLPPRLPVATPKAVRKYVLSPPDFAHLSEEEQQIEKPMTEYEKLEAQQEIAEQTRAAEEAKLEAEKLRQRQEASRAGAREKALEAAESESRDARFPTIDAGKLLTEMVEFGVDQKSLARQVYAALRGRGVDVSGFKSPEALKDYFPQLIQEELCEISSKFEETKAAC